MHSFQATLSLITLFLTVSTFANWSVKPWPNQFSMIQYQYWTISDGSFAIQNSSLYYNYDIYSYRCDNIFVDGSLPSSVPKNVTSIWINNTLNIITNPFNNSNDIANCTSLDIGFGMPVPTWFINDSILIENGTLYSGNGLWLLHELNVNNDITQVMKNTFHLKKDSPDGYFNYYAVNDDTQTPFRLDAPSGGYSGKNWIINDFYNFSSPGFATQDGVFNVPSECTSSGNHRHKYTIRKYKDIEQNDEVYRLVSSLGSIINYHIRNNLE